MNYEEARRNMITQQLRPWRVADPSIVDQFYADRREDFVPPAYRALAFADIEIPVGPSSSLLPPKLEGRILQVLGVQPEERVLEIGTGSGHMAALLAGRAREVCSIEIDPAVAELARANLARQGIDNVRVEVADGLAGFAAGAPFDVIVVSGGVEAIPPVLIDQLAAGGRLVAFVKAAPPTMVMRLLQRSASDAVSSQDVLEIVVPMLQQAEVRRFAF